MAWLRTVPGYAALPFGVLPALVQRFGLVAVPAVFVLLLGVGIWARRLARTLESRADAHARADDPALFACALEALYRVNLIPLVTGGRGTHPDLYDRLLAAGIEPGVRRPAPPSRLRKLLGMLVAVLVAAILDIAGLVGVAPFTLRAMAPAAASVYRTAGADPVLMDPRGRREVTPP